MPEQILNEFVRSGVQIDIPFLIKTFGVSEIAASKRMETYRKNEWKRTRVKNGEYDEWVLEKFMLFIDKTCPLTMNHLDWWSDELQLEEERNNWRY
jgi:hypothetical protein